MKEPSAPSARLGLSFQRSQTSGRFTAQPGPAISYYKRVQSVIDAPAKEESFFDGIDTSIPGIYQALRREAPAGAVDALTVIEKGTQAAVEAFRFTEPSASAPAMARALAATRAAISKLASDEEVVFVLRVKERQIQDALNAMLGMDLVARAQPAGTLEPTGQFAGFAAPPGMGPVVPGQTFEVKATLTNRSPARVTAAQVQLEAAGDWTITGAAPAADAPPNRPLASKFTVVAPQNAALSRPYFERRSIQEARYTVHDEAHLHRPAMAPPLMAVGRYTVEGVQVEIREPVTRLEANLPYGHDVRVLAVVPALAVTLTPAQAVVPLSWPTKAVRLQAEVTHNADSATKGTLTLNVPGGWKVDPVSHPIAFTGRASRRSTRSPSPFPRSRTVTTGSKPWRAPADGNTGRATTSSVTGTSRRDTSIGPQPRACAAST